MPSRIGSGQAAASTATRKVQARGCRPGRRPKTSLEEKCGFGATPSPPLPRSADRSSCTAKASAAGAQKPLRSRSEDRHIRPAIDSPPDKRGRQTRPRTAAETREESLETEASALLPGTLRVGVFGVNRITMNGFIQGVAYVSTEKIFLLWDIDPNTWLVLDRNARPLAATRPVTHLPSLGVAGGDGMVYLPPSAKRFGDRIVAVVFDDSFITHIEVIKRNGQAVAEIIPKRGPGSGP